jgi:hypothetical protein
VKGLTCSSNGETRNAYRILVEKSFGKWPPGKLKEDERTVSKYISGKDIERT